jgi:hypothetical protein
MVMKMFKKKINVGFSDGNYLWGKRNPNAEINLFWYLIFMVDMFIGTKVQRKLLRLDEEIFAKQEGVWDAQD